VLHPWLVTGIVPTVRVHVVDDTVVETPFCVIWQVTVRVCVPPPHASEQSDHAPTFHATGQDTVLQVRVVAGRVAVEHMVLGTVTPAEFTHDTVADCVPPPQSFEHVLHDDCTHEYVWHAACVHD